MDANDQAQFNRALAPSSLARKRPDAAKCRIDTGAHQSTLARTNERAGAHELTRTALTAGQKKGAGANFPSGSQRPLPSSISVSQTKPGWASCDAQPRVRSRSPRRSRVRPACDAATSSSRHRPDRRGPWRKWRARARRRAFPRNALHSGRCSRRYHSSTCRPS